MEFQGEILIFKIYLSGENVPESNIDLTSGGASANDWTFYPAEKEINLLPFFTFQVADVTESDVQTVKVGKK